MNLPQTAPWCKAKERKLLSEKLRIETCPVFQEHMRPEDNTSGSHRPIYYYLFSTAEKFNRSSNLRLILEILQPARGLIFQIILIPTSWDYTQSTPEETQNLSKEMLLCSTVPVSSCSLCFSHWSGIQETMDDLFLLALNFHQIHMPKVKIYKQH